VTINPKQTLEDLKAALGRAATWELVDLHVASGAVADADAPVLLQGLEGWAQAESSVWLLQAGIWRRVSGRDGGESGPSPAKLLLAEILRDDGWSVHLWRRGETLHAASLAEGQARNPAFASSEVRHRVLARTDTFLSTEKDPTSGKGLSYQARVYRRAAATFDEGHGPAWSAWASRFEGWVTR
jgi:hypothetical protein